MSRVIERLIHISTAIKTFVSKFHEREKNKWIFAICVIIIPSSIWSIYSKDIMWCLRGIFLIFCVMNLQAFYKEGEICSEIHHVLLNYLFLSSIGVFILFFSFCLSKDPCIPILAKYVLSKLVSSEILNYSILGALAYFAGEVAFFYKEDKKRSESQLLSDQWR